MNVDYDLYEGETASASVRHTLLPRHARLRPRRDRHGAGPRPLRRAVGVAPGGPRMSLEIDVDRVLADLRELARAPGGPDGARAARVDRRTGQAARDWLRAKLAELPVTVERDAAGNIWADAARAASSTELRHRRLAHRRGPGRRLARRRARRAGRARRRARARRRGRAAARRASRLVDWADEEGARFGRSLLGSSRGRRARSTPTTCATCSTARASRLQDALAALRRRPRRRVRRGARASRARWPTSSCTSSRGRCCSTPAALASAVSGTVGVERYLVTFTGQAGHAGSTPMHLRRDALAAAATRRARDPRGRHPPRRGDHRRRDERRPRASSRRSRGPAR